VQSKAVENAAVDLNKSEQTSELDYDSKDYSTKEDLSQVGQKAEDVSQKPSGKDTLDVNPFDPQENATQENNSEVPNNAENRRSSIQTPVFKPKKADDNQKTPEKPSQFDFTKAAIEETSPLTTIEEKFLIKNKSS